MKLFHHFESILPRAHRDIHCPFDAAGIHDLQNLTGILRVQVVVIIDCGKLCARYEVLRRHQHRTRLEIHKAEIGLRRGRHHRLKLVLSRLGRRQCIAARLRLTMPADGAPFNSLHASAPLCIALAKATLPQKYSFIAICT